MISQRPAPAPALAAPAQTAAPACATARAPAHGLALAIAWGAAVWAVPCSAQPLQPTPAALAAALPPADLARALALVRQAAATLAPPAARVEVHAGAPDPRLRLASCQRAEPFLPPGAPAWGRTRVGLRCAEGSVAWTVYLPVTVQATAPVLAPRTALPAGHVLGADDLAPVDTDWAAHAERPLSTAAELVGRTLARPAGPAQPLRPADLRRRQWFASGDAVRVVADGPGFSVSGEGLALADGLDGQRVRVQVQMRGSDGVLADRQVVNATATGARQVQVRLW